MSADLREAATELKRRAGDGYRCNYDEADRERDRAVAALLDAIAETVGYDDDRGYFLGVDGPIQRAGRAVAAAVLGEPPTERNHP